MNITPSIVEFRRLLVNNTSLKSVVEIEETSVFHVQFYDPCL
jgi:hypothetical protein